MTASALLILLLCLARLTGPGGLAYPWTLGGPVVKNAVVLAVWWAKFIAIWAWWTVWFLVRGTS